MATQEILSLLALKMTPGVGDVSAKQLISYCGSAASIFTTPKGKLLKIPHIGQKAAQAITSVQSLAAAEQAAAACEEQGVTILPYYHADYPDKLKLINDSPLLIYQKGTSERFHHRKWVGIVGTRQATAYGKAMTESIVEALKPHGAVVVSGLAYGIDIAAHRAALKNALPTLAVFAGGLDKMYPSAHRKTAEEILTTGHWISEQPLGTPPEAHHFPARNRIVAGMIEVLIVVESSRKGGSLMTANLAHSYNREVFAVPGHLTHTYSEGCNDLIRKQKASIYTGVEDLEYLLNWEAGKPLAKKEPRDWQPTEEAEAKVMEVLSAFEHGLGLDELSWKTQLSINKTVSTLLNMEFAGVIKSLPGKRYVKA